MKDFPPLLDGNKRTNVICFPFLFNYPYCASPSHLFEFNKQSHFELNKLKRGWLYLLVMGLTSCLKLASVIYMQSVFTACCIGTILQPGCFTFLNQRLPTLLWVTEWTEEVWTHGHYTQCVLTDYEQWALNWYIFWRKAVLGDWFLSQIKRVDSRISTVWVRHRSSTLVRNQQGCLSYNKRH